MINSGFNYAKKGGDSCELKNDTCKNILQPRQLIKGLAWLAGLNHST